MERSFAFLGPYDTILKNSRSFREPNLIKDASLPEIEPAIYRYSGISYNTGSLTQLYKAIHSYTQLYRAIHSYTELYRAIQSYTQLYTAIQS